LLKENPLTRWWQFPHLNTSFFSQSQQSTNLVRRFNSMRTESFDGSNGRALQHNPPKADIGQRLSGAILALQV
jgi:hypothetical protein